MSDPFDRLDPMKVKGGWQYSCDGMPHYTGCSSITTISRKWNRVGTKSTGWVICYGLSDAHTEDKSFVLAFCPSCAAHVAAYEVGQR